MKNQLLMKLNVAGIVTDELQARAGTDAATVQEYAECMRAGNVFPPVIVFYDGRHYYLADGFHRFAAARRIGHTEVEATVFEGSRKDALWYAVGANLTHGLKRSQADKRRAVSLALTENPKMSDRAIAEHCGVNHHLVTKIRVQMNFGIGEASPQLGVLPTESSQTPDIQPNESSGAETRIGKDGKVYPARHEPPALGMDRIGRKVPDCCMPIWLRGREVQDQLTLVSRLKGLIRRAQEENDPLYALMNYTTILPHLEQAWVELKTALPYAVCPMCQGHETTRTTCRLCRGRGLISQFHWDRCVTEEQKQIVLAGLKSQGK